uniref:Uncharacterized protein n=1 Tax=Kalanchoe fedtschenkoi TaxID=63787 RepID=A0A7N0V729_KALFE
MYKLYPNLIQIANFYNSHPFLEHLYAAALPLLVTTNWFLKSVLFILCSQSVATYEQYLMHFLFPIFLALELNGVL